MRRPSRWGLRARLTVVAMFAVLVGAEALGVSAGLDARPQAVAHLDDQLMSEARSLAGPATALLDGESTGHAVTSSALQDAAARTGFQVVVAEGDRVVLSAGGTPGLTAPALGRATDGAGTVSGPLGLMRWRVATVLLRGGTGSRRRVHVVVPYLRLQRELAPIRHQALLPGLVAALLAGAVAWVLCGRSLARPRPPAGDLAPSGALTPDGATALASARRVGAIAGHELRTPLTSLRANLDLIRRPETDAAERAEIAEAAGREVIRLTALVDRLQDLSAGAPLVEPAGPVDAARLAHVVCAAARRRHPAAKIEVLCPGPPARTLGTEIGLHTVVENLVENALRHGGPEVRVTVTTVPDGVRIVVEDSGPGIPDAERTEVVRPFRRGSTAAGAGSGLGLALVRDYAASVGGRLSIAGSGLGGARLTVTLPAAAPGPHPG